MTTTTLDRPLPVAPKSSSFNLQQKVVLLLLTLRAPGNSRTVRDKSAILRTNADTDRLSVGKRLLECDEQRDISILDGKLRDWIVRMSLPSPFKAGTHVIALDLLGQVDAGLQVYQEKRESLVRSFAAVYDDAKAKAKGQLGELYREEEYLSPDELKAAYSLDWQYVTLTPPEAIKGLDAKVFEREKARLAAKWAESVDAMRAALQDGLAELVDDMSKRLGDDPKKFKPSKLLERFDEFLSTFDARNVTDDEELKALGVKTRELLAGVDTEKLKGDANLRGELQAGLRDVAATLGERKQRRITFTDE